MPGWHYRHKEFQTWSAIACGEPWIIKFITKLQANIMQLQQWMGLGRYLCGCISCMVTPVKDSPARIVWGIGVAPLHLGNRLGCTFSIPLWNKITAGIIALSHWWQRQGQELMKNNLLYSKEWNSLCTYICLLRIFFNHMTATPLSTHKHAFGLTRACIIGGRFMGHLAKSVFAIAFGENSTIDRWDSSVVGVLYREVG